MALESSSPHFCCVVAWLGPSSLTHFLTSETGCVNWIIFINSCVCRDPSSNGRGLSVSSGGDKFSLRHLIVNELLIGRKKSSQLVNIQMNYDGELNCRRWTDWTLGWSIWITENFSRFAWTMVLQWVEEVEELCFCAWQICGIIKFKSIIRENWKGWN